MSFLAKTRNPEYATIFDVTLDSRFQGDGAFTNDGLQVFYRVILEPWTGGIKADTPLNPRFKRGFTPLDSQNGERRVSWQGVIGTLESAAPFSGRGRKDVEGGLRFSPQ